MTLELAGVISPLNLENPNSVLSQILTLNGGAQLHLIQSTLYKC